MPNHQENQAWYRLHRSSVIILTGAVLVCIVVNLPGQRRVSRFGPARRWILTEREIQHGWPKVFLRRNTNSDAFYDTYASLWRPWESVSWFSLPSLLLDCSVALLCCLGVATLAEWRRRHRCRLFQLRLLDMISITTMACAALAAWHSIQRSDAAQRRARAELNLHTQEDGAPWCYAIVESMLPSWIDELGVLPAYRNVVGADVQITSSDEVWQLGRFPNLRYLDVYVLEEAHVDVDYAFLDRLQTLRFLRTGSTFCTADTRYLEDFHNLEMLDLPNGVGLQRIPLAKLRELHVGAGGVATADLCRLQQIEVLDINSGNLTDKAMECITRLPTLTRLSLIRCNISDQGLAGLSRMNQLKSLALVGTEISNDSLRHLQGHPSLEYLHLSETSVTGYGLKLLGGVGQLRELQLGHTRSDVAQWTNEDIVQLQTQLPRCKIVVY